MASEGKSPILTGLEQSLITFLSQKREMEDKLPGGARRVRSLIFNIDLRDDKKPYFTVQIGMCEAAFSTTTGLKERGSCYGIERFVRDWFERPSVQAEIRSYISSNSRR